MGNINQGQGPIDASALEREMAAAKGGKRVGGGSGGFVGKSTKGLVVTQKDLPKEVEDKPGSGVTTFRVLPQMPDMAMPWVRYDEHFMFNEGNRAWASFNCFWRMSDGKEQCEGCDLISAINKSVVWPLEKMSKDEATEYMKLHAEHRGVVKFAGGSKAKTHIAMNVVFTSWGGGPVPQNYQGVRVLKVGAGIWKGTAKGVIGGMVAILQKYPNLTDPHEGPEIQIVKSGEGLDTSYPVTVVESRQLVDVGGRKMELEVPKLSPIAKTEAEIQTLLEARAGLSIFLKMKTHDEALSALQAVNTFIDPSTVTAKAPPRAQPQSTAATYTAPRTAQSDLETEFAGGPADDEDADKLPW